MPELPISPGEHGLDPRAAALQTPFVLPRIVSEHPDEQNASGQNAFEQDAPEQDAPRVHPASQYHLAPNESLARQLGAAAEERLLSEGDPMAPDVSEVPPGARLPLILRYALRETPPNLHLRLSGIDAQNEETAIGFEQQGRLEGEDLTAAPALVAWISCDRAWPLELFAFRVAVESRLESEDLAREVVRVATDALDELMPVWDTACTFDYIREVHWMGMPDDSERLYEAKADLAHSRGLDDPEDITDAEAREAASGYIWTTPYVEEILEEPYRTRTTGSLPPSEIIERLAHNGATWTPEVLRLARRVKQETSAFTTQWAFSHNDAYHSQRRRIPWALVSTVAEGGFSDSEAGHLIAETFEEEARREMESGFSAMPRAGVVFDPTTEAGREQFFSFLEEATRCATLCGRLAQKIDDTSLQAHSGDTRRRSVSLSEEQERAERSAPLPEHFLSGHRQITESARKAGSVLSALSPGRGRGSAERPLPSGAVPDFL